MKIPWYIYIIISIAMFFLTLLVISVTDKEPAKFSLFFLACVAFIVMGMIRFLDKETKHTKHKITRNKHKAKHHINRQAKQCPNCGMVVHANSNFCNRCGYRFY